MERDATLANITCDLPKGGTNATESLNGLFRLSCRDKNDMWFDVMSQYGDMGSFLSVLSLIGIVLYFVTSSDSGSLVIDCLSANGDPKPPVLQRVFWALTEGATAMVILFIKTDHFATKPLVRVDCIDEQCKFELYAVRKIALLIKT